MPDENAWTGFIGGELAYRFLKKRYPGGAGVSMPSTDGFEENEISKLKAFFGDDVYEQFRDKTVIDFGCGTGWACVDLAMKWDPPRDWGGHR